MAQRRMLSKQIVDSDAFIDMPTSARLLYYDFCVRADDDGFINNYKKIIRFTCAAEDDLKVLIAKKFIILFNNGVIVIKHWRIHNYIRSDRYKETTYKAEKATLSFDENNAYTTNVIPVVCQNDNQRDTQVRLGKVRLGEKDYCAFFDSLWSMYPSKGRVKKKESYKHYNATVKNDKDREDIKKAINNYINCDRVKNGYVQNGSTWFNNWQDWVEYLEPSKEDLTCKRCKGKGYYYSTGENGSKYKQFCDCGE